MSTVLDQSDGKQVAFNITTSKVVKTGSGRVVKFSTLVVGTSMALHDCTLLGDAAAGNMIALLSTSSIGMDDVNMPFQAGLVVVVTGGGAASLSYT